MTTSSRIGEKLLAVRALRTPCVPKNASSCLKTPLPRRVGRCWAKAARNHAARLRCFARARRAPSSTAHSTTDSWPTQARALQHQHQRGLTPAGRAAMDEPAAAQPSGGASYDSAEHEDARLGPYAKAPAQAQAPSAPSQRSAAGAKPADATIADYLLNGWTMLGEACPIAECYSPLMWQKKERRKFCPVHQLYVMTGALP
jgi:hypothetical protein